MAVRSGVYPTKWRRPVRDQATFLLSRTSQEIGEIIFRAEAAIGQPNDKYEKEADSVASHVVNNLDKSSGTIFKVNASSVRGKRKSSTKMKEEKMYN